MKKSFALLLVLAMICSLFVGCGENPSTQGTTPTDPSSPSGTENVQNPTEPVKEIKNVDRYPLEGDHKLSMAVVIEKPDESHFLNLFEEATGVDIEYQIVTSEQIPLLVAGGSATMPDVIFATKATSGLSIDQINEYGYAGAVINYAEHLDKMPNLAAAIAANPSLLAGVTDINGNFFTIPQDVFTLTSAGTMIYMRSDHLAEAGWTEAPATLDEFAQCLRDLKATFSPKDPEYIPFTMYSSSYLKYTGNTTKALFPSFGDLLEPGLTITRDQQTVAAGFASEQYKRFVTYMNGLYEEGLLDPDCFTAKSSYIKGFVNDGHTSVNSVMSFMTEASFASGNVDVIIPAPLTSEYNPNPTWLMPNRYDWWCALISSDCKDLDAALAYIDAMFAPAEDPLDEEGTVFGVCLWLGKLGRDWCWVEEGVSYQQLYPKDQYASRSEYDAGKSFGTAPYIGYFPYVLVDEAGKAAFKPVEVQKNMIPNVVEHIYVSHLKLTEDENDTYVDVWNDITSYVAQMNASFITGEIDIEANWAEYLRTLETLGLQDVLDVYQAALDRYNSK